jgi:hypothetical protein
MQEIAAKNEGQYNNKTATKGKGNKNVLYPKNKNSGHVVYITNSVNTWWKNEVFRFNSGR